MVRKSKGRGPAPPSPRTFRSRLRYIVLTHALAAFDHSYW
jgi:hypothetical protein